MACGAPPRCLAFISGVIDAQTGPGLPLVNVVLGDRQRRYRRALVHEPVPPNVLDETRLRSRWAQILDLAPVVSMTEIGPCTSRSPTVVATMTATACSRQVARSSAPAGPRSCRREPFDCAYGDTPGRTRGPNGFR